MNHLFLYLSQCHRPSNNSQDLLKPYSRKRGAGGGDDHRLQEHCQARPSGAPQLTVVKQVDVPTHHCCAKIEHPSPTGPLRAVVHSRLHIRQTIAICRIHHGCQVALEADHRGGSSPGFPGPGSFSRPRIFGRLWKGVRSP
jgi:hypothetical protein